MRPEERADLARFESLDYERFRAMAGDPALSPSQRIGFPDSYRQGHEPNILRDIQAKLPALQGRERTVLDIGPGAGELALRLIDHCAERGHRLILSDSAEVLQALPDRAHVHKRPGRFPQECGPWLATLAGTVDALICYSVFHYIFVEASIFEFLDRALPLLAPGGGLLIGDIPNVSQRRRFFSSEAGAAFHRAYTGRDEAPQVAFNRVEAGKIDDAVILAVLARCRAAGFDAYVLPQAPGLPLANRREDILVRRP
jgi:SAM-dependent methyltransferase